MNAFDSHAVQESTDAFNGMVLLLVQLLVVRAWTRSVAQGVRVRPGMLRPELTTRIIRAMAWRVALLVFIASPGAVLLATVDGALFALGLGVLFFPLLMSSAWQIAARFTHGTFCGISAVAPNGPQPSKPLITAASVADDTGSLKTEFSTQGLAYRRFLPTALEATVIWWFGFAGFSAVLLSALPKRLASSPWSGTTDAEVSPIPRFDVRVIAKNTLPTIALLSSLDRAGNTVKMGTGFWIGGDGTLVTNLHVIRGGSGILVNGDSANFEKAAHGFSLESAGAGVLAEGVLAFDEETDLAVLKVNVRPKRTLKIGAAAKCEIGDPIAVAGNPQGLENTVSTGIVSAKRGSLDAPVLQITAPISPGSSGSPVINAAGEVVGIATISSSLNASQNLNFAVPAEALLDLLKRSRNEPCRSLAELATSLRGALTQDDDFKRGCAALDQQDLPEAQKHLAQATAKFPEEGTAFLKLSEAWTKEAELLSARSDEAERRIFAILLEHHLQRAVLDEIKRASVGGWSRWPEILSRLSGNDRIELSNLIDDCRTLPSELEKRAKNGVRSAERAVFLDPESTFGWVLLGTARELSGDWSGATDVWARLVDRYRESGNRTAALGANQDELVSLLRSAGLDSEAARDIRSRGFDTFGVDALSPFISRLNAEKRVRIAAVLDQRRQLQLLQPR